ncbi:MAG: hypothetical protein J6B41_05920 [Alistipes sp.]|nr:hypothetical protein [Alistipes sp.]
MGTASMVLGIIALVFGFIPVLNIIGWILAVVGLILGIIALVQKKPKALAGVICNGIALLLPWLVMSVIFGAADAALF